MSRCFVLLKRRSLRLYSFLMLAAIVAAGCGTSAPIRLTELPRAAELRDAHTEPLRYSVAFAPVVVGELDKPETAYAAAVNPDAGLMRSELEQTLREFEVFKELSTLDEEDEAKALEAAKEGGADLLLTAEVKRYSVSYLHGRRGFGCALLWLVSPWFSWFVGDEVYSVDITLTMALKKTSDSSILWEGEIEGKASCTLSDLQRGLKAHEYLIGSVLTGPGSFGRSNYQKASSVVGPHAMQEVRLNLIDEMYKLPQPPPDKKSFAIVVGVNESRVQSLPQLKYAQDDATAFAELLKTGASPYDEVILLTGKNAMVQDLRKAIEDLGTREYIEITNFLVYFAGPGASADGRHMLAFSYSEGQDSMLSLEELYSLVESVEAANRVIILDAGFAGVGSRGIVLSGGEIASFEHMLADSSTIATLSACSANQGGHEFDKLGHGIFTAKLLTVLKGAGGGKAPADINGDGAVSAGEAITFLQMGVERYVRVKTAGQSQKPVLICGESVYGATVFRP